MKTIVTGAAGFIGSHLIKKLYLRGDKVLGIDLFGKPFSNISNSFGNFNNINNIPCNVLPMDISSEEFIKLLIDYEPECIFHLAADSNTLSSNAYEVIKNNTLSYQNILSYAKKTDCKLVYASSASVYGTKNQDDIFREENTKISPENPYAFSKYQMEIMSKKSNAVGLRFFNVYGPKEIFKKNTASVASQIYSSYLNNKEFILFEDSRNIYRDFVYIDDVIEACIKAAESGKGIYNVCTNSPRSFQEVYDTISKIVKLPKPKYKKNPINFGYQNYTCGSTERLKSLIKNFNPYNLEEGIEKMIKNFEK